MPTVSNEAVAALRIVNIELAALVSPPFREAESNAEAWPAKLNYADRQCLAKAFAIVRETLDAIDTDAPPPADTVRVEIPLDVMHNMDGSLTILCDNAEWCDGKNIYAKQLAISPPTYYVVADIPVPDVPEVRGEVEDV